MKKNTWLVIGILTSSIISSSCTKWLDAKPRQDIAVPTTLKDFQALLDNSQTSNAGDMTGNCPALGEIATNSHYIQDAPFDSRLDVEKSAYTWSNKFPYPMVSEWASVYSRVLVCNIILEGLSKLKPTTIDQEKWNNVKGQALFHRAKAFYEIAQIWAPVYKESSAEHDLGIPLPTLADITIPTSRSTIKETYDQIENDLKEAIELLPVVNLNKLRPSRTATYALLSRIYLSMQKYREAGFFADKSLNEYDTLMDYNDLPSAATLPISIFNTEVIFHSRLYNYAIIGAQARIPDSLVALYDAEDRRRKIFFGTSGGLTTFKGFYSGARVNFNGLATDEQYLIRAECYARDGKILEALLDLNTLLKSRWDSSSTFVPITAVDKEDALRKILLERRKELLFRGLIWSDLRRLNMDPKFAVVLMRNVNGQTYKLEPNSFKYTFPIPNDIIQQSGIIQNRGWN